jgi:hypothetical protein
MCLQLSSKSIDLTSHMTDNDKHALLYEWMDTSKHDIDLIPDYVLVDGDGQVKVRVRVHIMSIQNVNTVEQCFDAKLWIQFKWQVDKPFDTIDIGPTSEEWAPKLCVLNNVGKLFINETRMRKVKTDSGITEMYFRYVIQGTFAEHFELKQFPIDQQHLHIKMVLWGSPQSIKRHHPEPEDPPIELDFDRRIQFYQGNSIVYSETFIQQDTWHLLDKVNILQGRTLYNRNDDGIRYTTLNIYITIQRRVGFYISNVLFPIFLLVFISFISFILDASALGERMTITLTLLLTLVALKYIVAQYLPTTSYLTYLDMYILFSFLWITLVAGQNVLMYYLDLPYLIEEEVTGTQVDFITRMNRVSGILLTVIWVTFNSVVLLCLSRPIRKSIVNSHEDEIIGKQKDYQETEIPNVSVLLRKLENQDTIKLAQSFRDVPTTSSNNSPSLQLRISPRLSPQIRLSTDAPNPPTHKSS